MLFNGTMSLSEFDISIIIIISFLTSILIIIIYEFIKGHKRFYIDILNTNNIFYGKGKSGYLEKIKILSDKTTYIECNFMFCLYNETNHPYTMRNMHIVGKKGRKLSILEEGSLNINGTGKSVAGVTSYDKLKNMVINPYEGKDYDVNIRLSKDEYINYKKIYLCYRGKKNKNNYIRLYINKTLNKNNKN